MLLVAAEVRSGGSCRGRNSRGGGHASVLRVVMGELLQISQSTARVGAIGRGGVGMGEQERIMKLQSKRPKNSFARNQSGE